MTPDQVEDAGWSPEDWASFNDVATATVERHAQLRGIILAGPSAPNAYHVESPRADSATTAAGMGFSVDTPKRVTRIKIAFAVKADQLHDADNIRALIGRVATQLAHWEDRVIAYGDHDLGSHPGVTIEIEPSLPGLFTRVVDHAREPMDRVKKAARHVIKHGHQSPLAAACGIEAYLDLTQGGSGSRSDLDRARDFLGSRDASIVRLPPDLADKRDGLVAVFLADPAAMDIVWSKRPQISYVGTDNGDLELRLEEAFLFRIKDTTAMAAAGPAASQ